MPKFRQMPKLRRLVCEVTCRHCRSSRLARGLRLRHAMQTKPSIVFVHGIWADGSPFSKVIPTLHGTAWRSKPSWYIEANKDASR
jgi:hypothetical protein